jgi:hypothetical protein
MQKRLDAMSREVNMMKFKEKLKAETEARIREARKDRPFRRPNPILQALTKGPPI